MAVLLPFLWLITFILWVDGAGRAVSRKAGNVRAHVFVWVPVAASGWQVSVVPSSRE